MAFFIAYGRRKNPGNTLAEYALGATLIVGILITSLTAIDVPQLFQDILLNTMHGEDSSGKVTVKSYGTPYESP